ncbi:MAG TPA: hypothetical protein V6D20_12895, partial [Candidatus Obscuribacterales bacterium]
NSCTLSPGKLHKVRGFVRNSASVIFMGLPWSMLLILILSAQFPIKSIEAHGGQIGGESETNQGTTFWLTL